MNAPIRLRVLPALLPVDGRNVEFQSTDTHIQVRYVPVVGSPTEWEDLVPFTAITGPIGPQTELRVANLFLQYRAEGETEWIDLLPISDITNGVSAEVAALRDETEGFKDEAEAARDIALAAAGDAVAQGFVPIISSRDTAATYDLSAFSVVEITRWSASSAVAPAKYEKVAQPGNVEPSHAGKFQSLDGTWWGLSEQRPSAEQLGAVADGTSNSTSAIQSVIDLMSARGGGTFYLGAGVFMASTLVWKTGVYAEGAGYDVTMLRQIAGTNADFITSDGTIRRCGIRNLEIDGNYFTSAWNTAVGTTGNTSGGGIRWQGYAFDIDIVCGNVAGIGLYFAEPASESSAIIDRTSRLRIDGRDFGKEGLVIKGPNDWVLEHAFIGRAGILPRPAAETTFATSLEYPGDPVDGIVLDDVNIEVGRIHVYACWSGEGLRTRGAVRLEGEHLISESNNGQVRLSADTYGGVSEVSLRNLSLLHPNWTAATPAYSGPDPRWDAMTLDCDGMVFPLVKVFRTITAIKRVPGSRGVQINGKANLMKVGYRGATAPTGDIEAGARYSGDIVHVAGSYNEVAVTGQQSRGDGVVISGSFNELHAGIESPQGSGVRVTGGGNNVKARISGQSQIGGTGAAYYNGGGNNSFEVIGQSNAVPYESATGLGRTRNNNIYASTRSFTLASDAITITTFDESIVVDTEGAAATDNLATITGGAVSQRITIAAASSSRDVVLKDSTGNLRLAGDFTLDHGQDRIVLEYDGSSWNEISRADAST